MERKVYEGPAHRQADGQARSRVGGIGGERRLVLAPVGAHIAEEGASVHLLPILRLQRNFNCLGAVLQEEPPRRSQTAIRAPPIWSRWGTPSACHVRMHGAKSIRCS